jgi:hypothetical protein
VRLCLKHFRQHNYQEAFESLQRCTQVQLEDPLLSKLHDILVTQGDFEGTENFMEHSVSSKLHAVLFCVIAGLIFSPFRGVLTSSLK